MTLSAAAGELGSMAVGVGAFYNAVKNGSSSNSSFNDFNAENATNKQKGNYGEYKSEDNLINNEAIKKEGYDLESVGRDAPATPNDKIVNGINRFPKDNQSIICSTYQTSAMYEMEKILAMYSAGMPVEPLNEEFEYTIVCMENYGEHRIGYLYLLWMISLGILLETDKKNIERLSKLVEKENIKDLVIDYLLYVSDIGWNKITSIYYKENPYSKIREIIELAEKDKSEASKRMQKYMEKEWFKGHYDYEWKNAHKEPGYVGIWSLETAALAKILELDDTELLENNHYPYDLTHYKNTIKFKQVSLTEYTYDDSEEIDEGKEGIENNHLLEKIIPIKWHALINELISDYNVLDDSSFYEKYKKLIGLDQIWFLLQEYAKENKEKNLLGTLIVFAMTEKEYIFQLDYKEDVTEYYSSIKNYWDKLEVKLVQFLLDNDKNYYALVPKNINISNIYEITIIDVK
ncbi:PoNe immunity protein domain-containing protein [Clostridium botulinum]|uniref:PoNe immunity protein domain-containing protein n=1 Tax=Clostridium botulinum TaxID=1491 RepID=UPI001967B1AD|nr:PoNe immunity protein domain-containing protein [Clostridium botulinum]